MFFELGGYRKEFLTFLDNQFDSLSKGNNSWTSEDGVLIVNFKKL